VFERATTPREWEERRVVAEQVVPRRRGQYVECATCGFEVPLAEAVDVGLNPVTGDPMWLCKECDKQEQEGE